MNARERALADVARLRPRARRGDAIAILNIAADYRILGRRRLAFHWWKKGAGAGDGEALLEVGYCYHHGVGVRKSLGEAQDAYLAAIRSDSITGCGREEAQYHLAVLLLSQSRGTRDLRPITRLLREASADGDYPAASDLLAAVMARQPLEFCHCRRGLRRGIGAAHCPLHRPRS